MWKVFHEFILVVSCPFISYVDLKYMCTWLCPCNYKSSAGSSCCVVSSLCQAALVELLLSELKFCLGSFDEYVQTIT